MRTSNIRGNVLAAGLSRNSRLAISRTNDNEQEARWPGTRFIELTCLGRCYFSSSIVVISAHRS
jgi:hypothetical protein